MELSNGCIVGAMCSVNTAERLPENTVIFGGDCNRRVQQERPPVSLKVTIGIGDFTVRIILDRFEFLSTETFASERDQMSHAMLWLTVVQYRTDKQGTINLRIHLSCRKSLNPNFYSLKQIPQIGYKLDRSICWNFAPFKKIFLELQKYSTIKHCLEY